MAPLDFENKGLPKITLLIENIILLLCEVHVTTDYGNTGIQKWMHKRPV